MNINMNSALWRHTCKRISDAEIKADGDYTTFCNIMISRLKRIKNEEKIYYAIALLKERGYQEIVDIYEGKLLINHINKFNKINN